MTTTIESRIEGHAPATTPTSSPVYERSDGAKRIVVSAWVDADIAQLLDQIAAADGVTRSTLVREAVTQAVAKRSLVAEHGRRVPRKGHATQTHRRVTAADLGVGSGPARRQQIA